MCAIFDAEDMNGEGAPGPLQTLQKMFQVTVLIHSFDAYRRDQPRAASEIAGKGKVG